MNHKELHLLLEEVVPAVLANFSSGPPQLSIERESSEEVERLFTVDASRQKINAQQMGRDMARLIDHTALKANTTETQIRQLCQDGLKYNFASVCVNPHWVPLCADLLKNSQVMVCTVIGFPLGATTTSSKVFCAGEAAQLGAQEIDMVLNIGALKSKQFAVVAEDIHAVAERCHQHGAKLKVIFETVLLTDEEKIIAATLSKIAEADFVKTSTGFAGGGATVADVMLMRHVVGNQLGVKASGGIRTFKDAMQMIKAGATRIGASAGIRIVEETKNRTWIESKPSLSPY